MTSIRVAIVDDHPIVCSGIASMLSTWTKGKVVLMALNGSEYECALGATGHIDIALIDVHMPVRDGFSTLEWMRDRQPTTLPIMLAANPDPALFARLITLGARGLLCKSVQTLELHTALDHVITMGYYMNDLMRRHIIGRTENVEAVPQGRDRVLACLTKRELEVIEHICAPDDPTYPNIADRMGISENTVHTHRSRIFDKLGVNSRQGLLRAAINWKLLKKFSH